MVSTAIISQCTDPAFTDAVLLKIGQALDVQANRDIAPYYGGDYRVRGATRDNAPSDGELVACVLDDLPGEDQAVIGYHTWIGKPVIFVARNRCTTLIDGPGSVSHALSHELEALVDLACNMWADDQAGNEWAYEICDPVEGGYYKIDDVTVSDFVLPAFFQPGAVARYSYVQEHFDGIGPMAPFTVASGGYANRRATGSKVVQVFGELSPHQREKCGHWSSRSHKRGLRI